MDPAPPPRRPSPLTALLLVGFLVTSGVAVYALLRLRDAERDSQAVSPTLPAETDGEENLLERLLGGLGDLAGKGAAAGGAGAFECLDPEELVSGLLGGGRSPRGLEATVRTAARQVEEIRGLTFSESVEPRFLPPAEMARRVRTQVAREYPAELARRDERLLEALGAIPPNTDLRAVLQRALGEQVAGFYDPRTDRLVVGAGADIGTVERITLAHELEHALADQALGIPVPDEPNPEEEDADLAALALVEGDATLTMQRFALSLSLEEQLELFDPGALLEAQAGIEELPRFLQQQLLFPYEQGMAFVCDLYVRGGWRAVNQAYHAPPESTAEVLFPDRYPASAPADPADPPELDAPWREVETRPLGAASLLWLLEAPGGDASRGVPEADRAVAGWRGGEVHVWADGDRTAMGVVLEGEGLCEPVERWYRAAFPIASEAGAGGDERFALDGPTQDAALACAGEEVRLGIAPDLATARRLAA